jgi:hypothetical protein
MTDMEGGCLCSAVRYRVRGEPLHSAICHCKSCRKAAGSPSVAWVTFRRSDFQLLSGSPRVFSSSPGVLRTFCAHCGTPLTYESETAQGSVDVTTLSLDEPELFPPNREVWVQHRISWEPLDSRLAHYPQGGA